MYCEDQHNLQHNLYSGAKHIPLFSQRSVHFIVLIGTLLLCRDKHNNFNTFTPCLKQFTLSRYNSDGWMTQGYALPGSASQNLVVMDGLLFVWTFLHATPHDMKWQLTNHIHPSEFFSTKFLTKSLIQKMMVCNFFISLLALHVLSHSNFQNLEFKMFFPIIIIIIIIIIFFFF